MAANKQACWHFDFAFRLRVSSSGSEPYPDLETISYVYEALSKACRACTVSCSNETLRMHSTTEHVDARKGWAGSPFRRPAKSRSTPLSQPCPNSNTLCTLPLENLSLEYNPASPRVCQCRDTNKTRMAGRAVNEAVRTSEWAFDPSFVP